jgi:peptide/nickel transport system permease protein
MSGAAASLRPRRAAIRLPAVPISIAAAIVGVAATLAIFGEALAPDDPSSQDLLLGATGPSSAHPLGTDDVGRDVLSRLMAGARTAVVGPAVVALGSLLIGSLLGLVAGYRGGALGAAIMRTLDLIYALPGLLVAIVVAGVLGGGYWLAVAILIVLFCPYDARLVRVAVLVQRELPYVEAAGLLGMSSWRIMLREIWPNVRGIELANAFLNFAFALVTLSALSFLGIGAGLDTVDWGRMVADARGYLDVNPWAALAPGIALMLTAAAVCLLGDRLEERLSDEGVVE